jgi:hypothetical protein
MSSTSTPKTAAAVAQPTGTTPLTAAIRLTKWTASQPITKRLWLDSAGNLNKEPASQLSDGQIMPLSVTPKQFIATLTKIGQNDCLSYGVPINDAATRVMTRSRYASLANSGTAMARTADAMSWPSGPGLLMIDYDPNGPAMAPQDLLNALYGICPAMLKAAHIWSASASSCIFDISTGVEIRGICGQRIHVVAADATDIPRAGAVWAKRAWLKGYGHIKISAAGTMLARSIIDTAVFQTNRIDFCAPAQCDPPLVQRKPTPTLHGNPALALDTAAALPDLTPQEEAQYQALVAAAKAAARPAAELAREAYVTSRIGVYVATGLSPTEARRVVTDAIDNGALLADFVLTTEAGVSVTVGELLLDRAKWDGTRFADPIEPTYNNDQRIAKAFLQDPGRPRIYSFAHGGRSFTLHAQSMLIRLVVGERTDYMDRICRKLDEIGEFYQRTKALANITPDSQIVMVSEYQAQKALDRTFRFEKFNEKKKSFVPADVPLETARLLVGAFANHFPHLRAVLTARTIMPATGRLLTSPGYDQAEQVYLSLADSTHCIPEKPSLKEVTDALHMLWWPVRQFPYAAELDEAVMLTALLTSVVRPMLPTAPGFAFDAPIQASGKTLLIKVLAALAGTVPAMSPQPDSGHDEELRKRLFASLLAGSTVIVIDNIVGEFDSPSLATLVTSETYSDRILGKSRNGTVPSNALVLLSGNNLVLKGDLPRRFLKCRIDPQTESPHQRQFDFDPVSVVTTYRHHLVDAALTILKAAFNRGLDPRIGKGRMASFEVWDDLVRQAVCWLALLQAEGKVPKGALASGEKYPSLVDPMQAVTEAVQSDPARSQLGRLLNAWAAEVGTGSARETTVTTRQLEQVRQPMSAMAPGSSAADRPETLYEVLRSLAPMPGGGINNRALGKLLSKVKDQICGGYRLKTGPSRQGAITYWVEDLRGNGEFGESREFVPTASRKKSKSKISPGTRGNKLTTLTKLTAGRQAHPAGGTAAVRVSDGGQRGGLRRDKS